MDKLFTALRDCKCERNEGFSLLEDPNNPPACTCEGSNPDPLVFGLGWAQRGRAGRSTFDKMRACWRQAKNDETVPPDGIRETAIDTDGDGIPIKLERCIACH